MITRVTLTLFLAVALIVSACTADEARDTGKVKAIQTAEKSVEQDSSQTPEITDQCKLIAYYFYGGKRCVTCKRIEEFTREALETGFAEQLKSGVIAWRPVNLDEGDNDHFRVDYNLYTKSVILSKRDKGKETEWKNLEKIWELVRGDKEEYAKYIQSEIKALLGES